jgi:hypothetical protein
LTAHLEARLAREMEEVAKASIGRDVSGFKPLLQGKSGVGGIYDRWRALKALTHGEAFSAAHGGGPQGSKR